MRLAGAASPAAVPLARVGLSTLCLPETVNITAGAVSRLGGNKSLYPMHTVHHRVKGVHWTEELISRADLSDCASTVNINESDSGRAA